MANFFYKIVSKTDCHRCDCRSKYTLEILIFKGKLFRFYFLAVPEIEGGGDLCKM